MEDKSIEAPFYGMIEKVCVLLVDHDKEFATEMIDLLEINGYKVTTVMAHGAMSMLSKEKEKIDVMIINVNSPNSLCFKLLAQAVALNIISIVVCAEYNKLLAKDFMDNGAYLYMKRPLCEEIVKNLWQFVLREEKRREKARKELEANGDQLNVDDIGDTNIIGDEEQSEEKNMLINTDERKGKRGRKSTTKINEEESQRSTTNKTTKKKDCTEWAGDLHDKFTKAIDQHGEKNILEVMNMPNLMEDQISSHLQKYRNNNWRPSKEIKYIRQGSSSGSQQRSSYNISSERKNRTSCLNFGRMPSLQTNLPNQTQRIPELPPVNTNCIFDGLTQQQLYHPQLQVQPHYLNPFLMAQNDVGGGLQQQHDQLFSMLGSESTNHGSGLAFDGGNHHNYGLYHHSQNGYNLDLNTSHVPTMLSDIGVENVRNNELGAANANYQQYIGEQNMSDSSNIVAATNVNNIDGSNPNEWENCDAYLNFNNMNDLLQIPKSPSATLPNEHGNGSETKCPISEQST